jgi:ribosomal protein S18 acetylase RimI-like enzyme
VPRRDDQPAASIAPLAESELTQAIEVLARAFRDNALNRAVIRSDDSNHRLRSNRHGMRALLPVARWHGEALVATLDGVVAGSLVAPPPGRLPLPPPPLVSRLRCLLGQGWQVARRWSQVYEALEALHPKGPHRYLGPLGVDPRLQGRGVGGALLSRWLAGVDRDGAAAYLETDSERSVRFYERAGFALEGEAAILGVKMWRLRRVPRGPSAQ